MTITKTVEPAPSNEKDHPVREQAVLQLSSSDDELLESAWRYRDENPQQSASLLKQIELNLPHDSFRHGCVATVYGYFDIRVGRYDKALSKGFHALEQIASQDRSLWQSRTFSNIGIGCHETGNWVTALKYFQLQLDSAQSLTDENRGEACFSAHHNIARHYMLRGDSDEANRQFDLSAQHVLGNPMREAYLLFNKADCLARLGEYQQAEKMARASLEVADRHNLARAAIKTKIVIAGIAQMAGQTDRAITYLLNAKETADKHGLPAIRATLKLTELYLDDGKKIEASENLKNIEQHYKDAFEQEDWELFLKLRVRQLELCDDYQLALVWHKRYSDFREERNKQELDVRLATLQETNRIDALEKQSAQLKSKNSELQKNLEMLSQMHAVVKKQNETDDLTGLYNRRYLFDIAKVALDHTLSQNQPVSVGIIDVDKFKLINDRFGHAAGDTVLSTIAGVMSRVLRKPDLIVRYGGEEFVVLMPDTPVEQARNACERLRAQIENTSFEHVLDEHRVTVSIGIAQAENTDTLDTLLLKADKELYRAKHAGRNRVCSSASA